MRSTPAANWVLIYGNLGMPALGVEGSAWATNAARVYMAAFLYVAIRLEHRRRGHRHPTVALGLDRARIRRLIALGFPAASQVALEVGVFALATALAGPAGSGLVRRASDRAQHRVARVHGAARAVIGGGGPGRLRLRRRRSARGRRSRAGRRSPAGA